MTSTRQAVSMKDARILETEILLPKPKKFVRELVQMPDGYQCDWYYTDTPPSVMIVPVTADRQLVLVRQWRHNLKAHVLELPAGAVSDGEDLQAAALRELEEETGYAPAGEAAMRPLGSFYSLPSETNKYTHIYLASPVALAGPATGDAEIEKYFDLSVVLIPVQDALAGIGTVITSMETVGALMAARSAL
jgi:8-oxo-dGTP pyrophosphatase MutT (NUDIX family)